ncbi:MAG: hypothetical protein IID32_12505, partial [Planctomycetes bacterium]|nr:hypothetical protein [Planctomycetota bacterium]
MDKNPPTHPSSGWPHHFRSLEFFPGQAFANQSRVTLCSTKNPVQLEISRYTFPMIKTTTVGSYSQIDWLMQAGSEQAVLDATSVVISTQKRAGIDLPTDGELYRYDPDHPDTNGMIEFFTRQIGGIDSEIGITDAREFRARDDFGWRIKPAGVVREALSEGTLDLLEASSRSKSVAGD